eukprot:768292-Hanusia_phi.AAC.4
MVTVSYPLDGEVVQVGLKEAIVEFFARKLSRQVTEQMLEGGREAGRQGGRESGREGGGEQLSTCCLRRRLRI